MSTPHTPRRVPLAPLQSRANVLMKGVASPAAAVKGAQKRAYEDFEDGGMVALARKVMRLDELTRRGAKAPMMGEGLEMRDTTGASEESTRYVRAPADLRGVAAAAARVAREAEGLCLNATHTMELSPRSSKAPVLGTNLPKLPILSDGTPHSSPASASGSGIFNDSQDTVVTIPDEHPSAGQAAAAAISIPNTTTTTHPSYPLSASERQAEISRISKTLRLKLKLAHYKVRTNQIHVPLAELEIRSMPSHSFSRASRTAPLIASRHHASETQQAQTPHPAPISAPIIHFPSNTKSTPPRTTTENITPSHPHSRVALDPIAEFLAAEEDDDDDDATVVSLPRSNHSSSSSSHIVPSASVPYWAFTDRGREILGSLSARRREEESERERVEGGEGDVEGENEEGERGSRKGKEDGLEDGERQVREEGGQ